MNIGTFPQGFYWGTATSAYQIEGAVNEDGRSESVWDRFAATPGKIRTGETGNTACDSYHRYMEDIAAMRAMHVNAYRFSIAWPRVIPGGIGPVNMIGLDYYDRLVDALLEAGIEPFVTLFHWDLPQALEDTGGWLNRATIDAFLRYTDVVVSHLGDRVTQWITHNEPWCVSIMGYEWGMHAPGFKDRKQALQVAHHVLVSHGLAVPLIRQNCPEARIGIVLNFTPLYPATDSPEDAAQVRLNHGRNHLWFIDPLYGRGYPQKIWDGYEGDVPEISPGDIEAMAVSTDFLGVNYYSRGVVASDVTGKTVLHRRDDANVTGMDWEVYPQGLYDLLTWIKTDYPVQAIYIAENGSAYPDELSPDGHIHDSKRQGYLRQHLEALSRAIQDGVPVQGYFCWSLLDNFEWTFGMSQRFGLVHVDFDTYERRLKDSALWYGRVAAANGFNVTD